MSYRDKFLAQPRKDFGGLSPALESRASSGGRHGGLRMYSHRLTSLSGVPV